MSQSSKAKRAARALRRAARARSIAEKFAILRAALLGFD